MTPDAAPHALVVECDSALGPSLVAQLTADGYRARLAQTIKHARSLARGDPPAIVLLGQLQPPEASLELLAEIRGQGAEVRGQGVEVGGQGAAIRGQGAEVGGQGAEVRGQGVEVGGQGAEVGGQGAEVRGHDERAWRESLAVIVIGPHTHAADVLRAFEAGADDFVARSLVMHPVGYLELRARLRAVLRRATDSPAAHRERLLVGALVLDLRSRAVTLGGRPVRLAPQEYRLLVHLAREPHRVFTKRELLQAVWGHSVAIRTRTLDTHASRLRRRLRAAGGESWVLNVRGVGYRLI